MFIEIKDTSNPGEPIILKKEDLQEELKALKSFFEENTFNVLNKVLNLEESAYIHFKLFKSLNRFEIIKLIYNFNVFYMSLNFIKDYFEKKDSEFKCTYNKDSGRIHLSYKNISLLSICYSDTFLTALYFFSQNLESFLANAKNLIINLQEKANDYQKKPSNLTYDENLEYCKFLLTQTNHKLFCNLNQSDIDVINNFYSEYIDYLKLDLNTKYKGIPLIATYDLSYPGIIK